MATTTPIATDSQGAAGVAYTRCPIVVARTRWLSWAGLVEVIVMVTATATVDLVEW